MVALEQNTVELKSHHKLYDVNFKNGCKELIVSPTPSLHKTAPVSTEGCHIKDTEETFFQYRYLIAFIQFLIFCQINCFRQVTSVSIVAMVTQTQNPQFAKGFNVSKQSCPVNPPDLHSYRAPEIDGEFDWSPSTQGYILSAGFLGYVMTQMIGGMLAETFGAKYIITFGLLISSICHFISPFVSRVHSNFMIFIQVVRGMGQGLLPAAHCVVAANWFSTRERGLLNTIVMSGFCVGGLVGGIATGAICSAESLGGWPFGYYLFGSLGVLLSFSFWFVFFESPKNHPKISAAELKYIEQDHETDMSKKRPPTPWRRMLCSVQVHALILSLFPQFWVGSYILSVHPTFLGTILNFRIQENGAISSIPFALQTVAALFVSWSSNWLQKNNYVGVNRLRKGFSAICYFGYFLTFMGMYAAGCNKWLNVTFNMLQAISNGMAFGGTMIVAVDMTPRYGGSLMGLASTIASTGGFILPIVVGALTNNNQTLEQWNKVFFVSGAISLGAGIIFCAFGSGDVQPWNFETTEEYENYKATCENKNKEKFRNDIDTVCHL